MADDFENLDERLAHLSDEFKADLVTARKLRTVNARSVAELEAMGVGLEIAHPRIDHLLLMLHEFNVVTDEQYIKMQLAWETQLRNMLAPIMRDVKVATRKHIQPVQQPKRLLKPGKDF